MKNLRIADLKNILRSKDFKKDLEEISSYCANIKQERPIMYLIAKYLKRKGFMVALEMKKGRKEYDFKKYDLIVNDTTIEAKFFYESDIEWLKKELKKAGWIIKKARRIGVSKKHGWKMLYPIIKDLDKKPNIFILMIISRDLRKLEKNNPDLL